MASLAHPPQRPHPPQGASHRDVLKIALPIMLANVSTPLLGTVDTAVIGQLVQPHYIGAVAIGAMMFNFIYWAFGFLRMGTTGLAAQADGAGNAAELRATLGRALMAAAAAGLVLIVLQWPISHAAFALVDASAEVESHAATYFTIRIWSAPAALANYALLGWLIGIGRANLALVLQLVLNGTNIALDAFLVLGLGMGVDGIAIGTVAAEIVACLAGLWLVRRELAARGGAWDLALMRNWARLAHMLAVNRDIMIRTLCLLFAFSFFTAQGAASGDIVLAANAILLNFLMLSGYLLDGFAFAAETLIGKSVGARRRGDFLLSIKRTSQWGVVFAGLMAAAILLLGPHIIDVISVNETVRAAARAYLPWAAAAPLVGIACFQLDGIFIGATRTADMRNMMILSLAAYLAAWWALVPAFANHGLWGALMVFFVVRALTLGWRFPKMLEDLFGPAPAARRREA